MEIPNTGCHLILWKDLENGEYFIVLIYLYFSSNVFQIYKKRGKVNNLCKIKLGIEK